MTTTIIHMNAVGDTTPWNQELSTIGAYAIVEWSDGDKSERILGQHPDQYNGMVFMNELAGILEDISYRTNLEIHYQIPSVKDRFVTPLEDKRNHTFTNAWKKPADELLNELNKFDDWKFVWHIYNVNPVLGYDKALLVRDGKLKKEEDEPQNYFE